MTNEEKLELRRQEREKEAKAEAERAERRRAREADSKGLEVRGQPTTSKHEQSSPLPFNCTSLMDDPQILAQWQLRYCPTQQPQCLAVPPCANNNAQNESSLN